jgi:hypothetical protein
MTFRTYFFCILAMIVLAPKLKGMQYIPTRFDQYRLGMDPCRFENMMPEVAACGTGLFCLAAQGCPITPKKIVYASCCAVVAGAFYWYKISEECYYFPM